MKTPYPENWPQFFTATIMQWKYLLQNDLYKEIIIDALRFAVKEKRIKLFAFVIMNNHIHIVWQQLPAFSNWSAGHRPRLGDQIIKRKFQYFEWFQRKHTIL